MHINNVFWELNQQNLLYIKAFDSLFIWSLILISDEYKGFDFSGSIHNVSLCGFLDNFILVIDGWSSNWIFQTAVIDMMLKLVHLCTVDYLHQFHQFFFSASLVVNSVLQI